MDADEGTQPVDAIYDAALDPAALDGVLARLRARLPAPAQRADSSGRCEPVSASRPITSVAPSDLR